VTEQYKRFVIVTSGGTLTLVVGDKMRDIMVGSIVFVTVKWARDKHFVTEF